jgi:hypothetical protein
VSSSRNVILAILAAVLLVLILWILSSVIFGYAFFVLMPLLPSNEVFPEFLSKGFEYDLYIQNYGPLQNATFYIPLPVKNGRPMIGNRSIVPEDFEKEGLLISFTTSPPEWNLSYINGKQIFSNPNELWFVRIHADSWPNETYRVELHDNAHNLQSPSYYANTLYPVGNESIILPKFSFSPPSPVEETTAWQGSELKKYTNTSSMQFTWIYADLTGDHGYYPGTQDSVSILLRIQVQNGWLDGYDTWRWNYYEDYFFDSVIAPSHGGHFIAGNFKAGEGYFPDLSSAKWQQFMLKSQQDSKGQ